MNYWDDLADYRDQHSFAGAMAVPRSILLSSDKTQIGMVPVSSYKAYRSSVVPFFFQNGFKTSPVQISNHSKTMELQISVSDLSSAWGLNFYGSSTGSEGIVIAWNPGAKTVSVSNQLPSKNMSFFSPKINSGFLVLTILLDTRSLELFINSGLACGTLRFVPPPGSIPSVSLSFSNQQLGAKIGIKAWKLQSIWAKNLNVTTPTPVAPSISTTATTPSGGNVHQKNPYFSLFTYVCHYFITFILFSTWK